MSKECSPEQRWTTFEIFLHIYILYINKFWSISAKQHTSSLEFQSMKLLYLLLTYSLRPFSLRLFSVRIWLMSEPVFTLPVFTPPVFSQNLILCLRWSPQSEKGTFVSFSYLGGTFGSVITFPLCGEQFIVLNHQNNISYLLKPCQVFNTTSQGS